MPTYEYRCAEGHITEAFQKMTDPPLKRCATCGKKVERVLFAPTIHYKGTGFYSTDYGKGGKKGKDAAAKGETKTEGKKKDGGDAGAKKAESASSAS